jgi:DNA-binding transcriptional MerR regulator
VNDASRGETRLTIEELAMASGITTARLVRLVSVGLIEPANQERGEFTAAEALRLKRMLRLRADLGVNLFGAAIILDLVDRLHTLEADRYEGAERGGTG